jgi:hypothetical protein
MTADDLTETAESAVRSYYDALRDGRPLGPFFADGDVVKFGISEQLVGGDAVRNGLREQTRTTTDWVVESDALRVTERPGHAWFADQVTVGWTDTERRIRYEFDSRWSGTMERRAGESSEPAGSERPATNDDAPWRFVGMHVSTPGEL